MSNPQQIENLTYEELQLGQTAQLVHTLTLNDIQSFALVSGDVNPAHVDPEYAEGTFFHGVIAHGMFAGALISSLLGTEFPGPGTIYLEQSLRFLSPVRVGDTLTVQLTVLEKDDTKRNVRLSCEVVNQKAEKVVSGEALVKAPKQKVIRPRVEMPSLHLFNPNQRLRDWIASLTTAGLPPLRCAVAHPCDEQVLRATVESARHELIQPILIGPQARIAALADSLGISLEGFECIDTPHSHASAQTAVELAVRQEVDLILRGSLLADELIDAVQAMPELRTGRCLSHVFHFEVPTYAHPLLVTDCIINIKPSLEEKADILRNVIELANVLGLELPKVAILSAVERIPPQLVSSLDAAALCKMADRGQIPPAIVDGPLAFDSAISLETATLKGLKSPVAGQADILMAPDLESGYMLARQLESLAGASGCGVVMGARLPIALSSRADNAISIMASVALAVRLARAQQAAAQQ